MLIPIGVASISFTWLMPGADTAFTCAGSASPRTCACRPGIRLSRINVVFPEPDTPVTAVSRPFGIFTVNGFTVWIWSVVISILPSSNILSDSAFSRTSIDLASDKKPPILDSGSAATSVIVPCEITFPPFSPASGPISIIQSASFKIWVS